MSYLVTFEIFGASGRPVSFASEEKISGQLCVGLFPEVNFTTPSWAQAFLDTIHYSRLVWPGRFS